MPDNGLVHPVPADTPVTEPDEPVERTLPVDGGSGQLDAHLQLRAVVKRFPGIVANDRVDLQIRLGEVHALVGENGAGKSTLVKILSGVERPDSGEIRIDGVTRHLRSSRDAIAAGIGTVHQHFMLFESLSVAENVVFGREPRRAGLIDRSAAQARVKELAEVYGLPIDPRMRVDRLPVGLKQRVEILKALHRDARVLVLDEPTAVLTPQEVDQLFAQVRRMAAEGRAVLFVTHKMAEVMAVSDRVTVLRRGLVVGDLVTAETKPREIVRLIVGSDLKALDTGSHQPAAATEPVVLATDDLMVPNDLVPGAVDGVSLRVRAGEILGVAGVAGNGQPELVETIVGLRHPTQGRVLLDGDDITALSAAERRARGIVYVPEDRLRDGIAAEGLVFENLVFGGHRDPALVRWRIMLQRRALVARAVKQVGRYDVRTPGVRVRARTLSGGNLQKLVLARELSRSPRVLVAAEPTRGLDVAATRFVHQRLLDERANGTAILLVSSELSEISQLADRAIVMLNGRVAGEFDPKTTSRADVGALMIGAGTDDGDV